MPIDNPPGTYVPALINKDQQSAAREIQEAFQRHAHVIDTILARLLQAGIPTGGEEEAITTFYQRMAIEGQVPADQRDTLTFEGAGLTISDGGDRTILHIPEPTPVPAPDGSSENLNNFFAWKAVENYALSPIVARSYR